MMMMMIFINLLKEDEKPTVFRQMLFTWLAKWVERPPPPKVMNEATRKKIKHSYTGFLTKRLEDCVQMRYPFVCLDTQKSRIQHFTLEYKN